MAVSPVQTLRDEMELVALFNELEGRDVTIERMRQMRDGMRRLDVLARRADAPVGFGLVGLFPGMDAGTDAAARFAVRPSSRGRGIGTTIHELLLSHARELGKTRLEVQARETDVEAMRWLRRRGYKETERLFKLRLDLAGAPRGEVAAPTGVTLVTLAERPDLQRALFDIICETTSDIPGTLGEQPPDDFARWAAVELDEETRPAALTLLALAQDQVIGYGRLMREDANTAYHLLTGVSRAWRAHGVGRAIKLAQLDAARNAGYRYCVTDTHVDNEPIRRLNEKLGYQPFAVTITLVGPDGAP